MSLAVTNLGNDTTRAETMDIYFGAYLLSKGAVLEETKLTDIRNDKASILFTFSGANVPELSREFQSGLASVNVASFKVAMTHLKDVMFTALRSTKR